MKKIMCAVAWLCAAFVLFAQTTDESITDSVYQKLLQYRVAHDSNYRQLQMQADIAANKAEKAKTESLVTMEVGSGNTEFILNTDANKRGITTEPYAALALPSYNNTGIKLSVPYSKKGQNQITGVDVAVSTDIYSKNAEAQKYTRNLAQSAADQARQAKEEGFALAEKQFLQNIQQLLDDYAALLDKELNEVKAEIVYNQTKAQGYADSSTKMRTANLELVGAKREHQNARFNFSVSYRVFMESCGLTADESPQAFLTALWNSIPVQQAADIEHYAQSTYKPLAAAERQHTQNKVKRDIELSPFSIAADAGYKLRNTKIGSGSATNEHSVLGGLSMQFPGGKAYTGVEVPLADPKNTALRLSFSWNPFSIQSRKLDKKNAELDDAIERLKIEDAKEQYQKQLNANKIMHEQMMWQQAATVDELSIYKQNAEDHGQWYRSGIISKVESLQAELEYKKAEVRSAKAKTAVMIFNIDTALLFERQ